MSNTVELDKKVSDFSAETNEGTIHLKDFAGKYLVLYFYPKDNTPGCTNESKDFRDHYDAFTALNAEIVGVSRDSLKSHQNFIDKHNLPFELIADTEETLCQQFDVIKEKNMFGKIGRGIERSTFLINPKGVLIAEWRKVKVAGHVAEVLQTLKASQ
ncbi:MULTISPECIES: peroxiredoxin [Oligella]|uniref:thioredoxin-dependent peroxiredoxin n=2 Tax=Oligella urethralis TaxID=90245 RepID=A0A095Z976_9BURK|nr:MULTISPECIES: peroxiredoxin [Oligella]AVL71264.1 peroxiredoxin [Oligella urethralis]KGF31280.1 alkyl hydroperoxide reductase [Oligella urethralis DNF00040]MDK6202773.1 peroxiredoxin [Oligella urethralis]OFS87750.1 alkyl hydroperoxide reductase [Oligella sp. HMSC05A10]OFV47676.1 alkyl hydroperoxide reductase [Oligella sp. HMSC09E12]